MIETKLPGMVINRIDTKSTYDSLVKNGEIGENDLCLVENEDNISLGVTGASVGDIIKVKAVDADGKPTEWEAAGEKLDLLYDDTLTEKATVTISQTSEGVSFATLKLEHLIMCVSMERLDELPGYSYKYVGFTDGSEICFSIYDNWGSTASGNDGSRQYLLKVDKISENTYYVQRFYSRKGGDGAIEQFDIQQGKKLFTVNNSNACIKFVRNMLIAAGSRIRIWGK